MLVILALYGALNIAFLNPLPGGPFAPPCLEALGPDWT
jgi:hypothetical protein